jgi:transcriptional regulator with XRE-family HTH domain
MRTIEETIRVKLLKEGISINDFCEEIGISGVALRSIFQRNDMKLSLAVKVCKTLNIEILDLIDPEERKQVIGYDRLIEGIAREVDYKRGLESFNQKLNQNG